MARSGWEPWRPGQGAALPGLERVIGHRGAAIHAPENTLSSIRKAFELGARWIETDVKLTSDGVPILMHDETLDRTTNGMGSVAAVHSEAVAALDAGGWFAPAFAGERVPTLRATLSLLLELGMGANIEIKPCLGHEVETAEVVARELAHVWPDDAPPLLISSFSIASLAAAHRAAPDIPRGLLLDLMPPTWASLMSDLQCTTLHLWHEALELEQVRDLAARDVPVLCYTVNGAERARALLTAGVRAIITDAPDRILPVSGAQ
jgi:glycerophosphoryl diester phosphodiesterase